MSSTAILPQPFEWKTIRQGKVKILAEESPELRLDSYIPCGTAQVFDVFSFNIAKYPITNAQFARFIEGQGYEQSHWWSEAGWHEKLENNWTQPRYWHEPKWNQPDYPVVGVSWYEAAAFCNWLSEITAENISLPTEQEWQRAAQGDTDRQVAWGDYDNEVQIRGNWDTDGTTPVTYYEGKGDGPFGVVDMTGNVWEWCRTEYFTGQNDLSGTQSRIARGGSWALLYSYALNIRVTDRLPLYPVHRLDYVGFPVFGVRALRKSYDHAESDNRASHLIRRPVHLG